MTISAALRTDSITSPRALHTPTCPGVSPRSLAQGAAPDTGLERGSLAKELRREEKKKDGLVKEEVKGEGAKNRQDRGGRQRGEESGREGGGCGWEKR